MSTKKTSSAPSYEDKWRAESDARTLVEAEKIKADKGRHKAAIGHASKEQQAYQNVTAKAPTARRRTK